MADFGEPAPSPGMRDLSLLHQHEIVRTGGAARKFLGTPPGQPIRRGAIAGFEEVGLGEDRWIGGHKSGTTLK